MQNKDKKYAWQLEHDSDYTSSIVFDSIEECIADAQDYFAEENVKIKIIHKTRNNAAVILKALISITPKKPPKGGFKLSLLLYKISSDCP